MLEELPEDLRVRALTHPAFASSSSPSYERLEFLGDSVLGLAITDELYRRFPDHSEGDLTRMRAVVVSRDSCAVIAKDADLGEVMVAQAQAFDSANQKAAQQLSQQRNALAALTESVLGAAFLAFGFEAVSRQIVAIFEPRVAYAQANRIDARSKLQELASRSHEVVVFSELSEEGPPHDRRFTALVEWSARSAQGSGRSKQEAQQSAAAALLSLIEQE